MIMMYHASLLMTFLDLLERREGPHTVKNLCKISKSQYPYFWNCLFLWFCHRVICQHIETLSK